MLTSTPSPIAIRVRTPCGTAIGPLTGNPVQTQRTIVLESDSSECIAKKTPANPSAGNVDELFDEAGDISEPEWEWRDDLKAARTPRANPSPFQPPFSACMIGHKGLFVRHANLATLERIR